MCVHVDGGASSLTSSRRRCGAILWLKRPWGVCTWTYLTRWEPTLRGGGELLAAYAPAWMTSQTSPLDWLCWFDLWMWILANQIRATGWTHRVDFCTADLYFILVSDHNDNFSKYNKNKVTEYSFKISLFIQFIQSWKQSLFICIITEICKLQTVPLNYRLLL